MGRGNPVIGNFSTPPQVTSNTFEVNLDIMCSLDRFEMTPDGRSFVYS